MTKRRHFGSLRRLPSGRYQASYWHEGFRYNAAQTFATKGAANAYLSSAETDIARGAWIDPGPSKVTFREYADSWLAGRHDLAERTAELYRWLLDRHVYPTFGAAELGRISASAVRGWHAANVAKHPTTAAKAYRLLREVMGAAVADNAIARNPCQVKGAGQEKAPERPVATVAEVDALAQAMPERQRIAVSLAAWCQLRRGELLGLRRRDVDPLHVPHTTVCAGERCSRSAARHALGAARA